MVQNTTQKVEMDLLDQVTTIVVEETDMEIEIHMETDQAAVLKKL